jgi:hypothetical protein
MGTRFFRQNKQGNSASTTVFCFRSGFLMSPPSPSPERIVEAFRLPLLEKEHIAFQKINHAPWVAT